MCIQFTSQHVNLQIIILILDNGGVIISVCECVSLCMCAYVFEWVCVCMRVYELTLLHTIVCACVRVCHWRNFDVNMDYIMDVYYWPRK